MIAVSRSNPNWTREFRQVERLFCIALAADSSRQVSEIPELYAKVGDKELWEFCSRQGSASIVASALVRALGAQTVAAHWHQAARDVESRLTLFLAQLDRAAAALAANGITMVALKNSGIARGIHRKLAECPMGAWMRWCSIRLLRAQVCLERLGYKCDSRSPLNVEALRKPKSMVGRNTLLL